MGQLLKFQSLAKGSKLVLSASFLDDLATGDTINGATVSAVVFSGTDASPGDLISGVADYSASPVVTQLVDSSVATGGGVAGVIYTVIFTVTTSDGNVYSKEGRLAVITPGGKFGS